MANRETQEFPRALRIAFWILLGWSLVVTGLWRVVAGMGIGTAEWRSNVFYYLFLHYELVAWLVLMFGVVICLGVCFVQRAGPAASSGMRLRLMHCYAALLVLLGVLWCGTLFIYHRYPFSMDEFNSIFQAKIFASGHLKAVIPELWRPYARALTPVYVALDKDAYTWISMYLPVYAAMRALCLEVGLTDLLNPILAVVSVVLVADCARRLWPDQPRLPLIAAILLLTSTQFLATSISYYSMPAHLCANLLWLSLYLRNTRASLAWLPWVGGLALGLHQPVVHPPFVAPFCFDIVRRRRFGLALYCVVVYGGFLVLWHHWHQFTAFQTADKELRWFKWPNADSFFLQAMELTLLASWQSVALVLCGACALLALRRFDAPLWCLLAGILLTSLLYLIYILDQGHGWGHRYAYGVLGNVVLLGTYGFHELSKALGQARAVRLLVASTCYAVLVQIPLRTYEVETEIRPYAHARDYLRGLAEKIVVVDRTHIWYGHDLIRNDPALLETPLLLDAKSVPAEKMSELQRLGSLRWVPPTTFAGFGIPADSELTKHARELEQAARAHTRP